MGIESFSIKLKMRNGTSFSNQQLLLLLKQHNENFYYSKWFYIVEDMIEIFVEESNHTIVLSGCFSCYQKGKRKMVQLIKLFSSILSIEKIIIGTKQCRFLLFVPILINYFYFYKRREFTKLFGKKEIKISPHQFYDLKMRK